MKSFLFRKFIIGLVFEGGAELGDSFAFQNPREFYASQFLGQIWLVYIPFVNMAKLQYLAQFPVDHFLHPFMLALEFLLFQFTAFAYHVVNDFISVSI